jgi:membrane dipeptidase
VYRRQFLIASASTVAIAAAQLAGSRSAAAATRLVPRARIVIDALSEAADPDRDKLPLSAERVRDIRASGVTAVNWTVSSPDLDRTLMQIAYAQALVDSDPHLWSLVRKHSDIRSAAAAGQVGILLGFQHPQPLAEHGERLETFRRLGVRIMQLTYNNRSYFGDGCLEPADAGLSRAGRTLIERMNALGVAVDLGHAGMRTTAEAIAASKMPALITHSGCRALHDHPRNQPDVNLKTLADRGGVVGIYFMPYLVASPIVPTAEHVIDHLAHALDVAGTEHVGIGSDGAIAGFAITDEMRKVMAADMAERKRSGIAAPEEDRLPFVPELNLPGHMDVIAAGLAKRGYSPAVVDKVLGGSFHRVLGEIWGTA